MKSLSVLIDEYHNAMLSLRERILFNIGEKAVEAGMTRITFGEGTDIWCYSKGKCERSDEIESLASMYPRGLEGAIWTAKNGWNN